MDVDIKSKFADFIKSQELAPIDEAVSYEKYSFPFGENPSHTERRINLSDSAFELLCLQLIRDKWEIFGRWI